MQDWEVRVLENENCMLILALKKLGSRPVAVCKVRGALLGSLFFLAPKEEGVVYEISKSHSTVRRSVRQPHLLQLIRIRIIC